LERWGQTNELTIYLQHPPSLLEQNEIEKILLQHESEASYEYIDNEKMIQNLQSELPALAQEINKNPELTNILPAHFIIRANQSVFDSGPSALFKKINDAIKNLPIIAETSHGEPWLKKYSVFLNSIKGLTFFIYLGLCSALVLVIGNSIRSSILSKKDEIEVFKLLGATPETIQKPFLKDGAFISFIAMSVALVITSIALIALSHLVKDSYNLFGLNIMIKPLKFYEIAIFALSSIVLGVFGSFWVIKSYTDELFIGRG
jgi:cell division transport system permease protein